jgi:hypothetical protein
MQGKRIVAPAALDSKIDTIFVGLNPQHGRSIVAGVAALQNPPRRFFYL